MADEGATTTTIFPPPPPFYKQFTVENLERLKQLKEAKSEIPGLASSLLELPPELRCLVPPEPPSDGIYRSFGETVRIYDPLPTLKNLQVEQLYPESPQPDTKTSSTPSQWTIDRAFYLKNMIHSILLSYLELVGVLSTNVMPDGDRPPLYEEKTRQLASLFFNAHQLINEYRPHQARESLIIMMEEQLEKRRAEIEAVKGLGEKVSTLLGDLGKEDGLNVTPSTAPSPKQLSKVEVWKEEQRAIWAALNEEISE